MMGVISCWSCSFVKSKCFSRSTTICSSLGISFKSPKLFCCLAHLTAKALQRWKHCWTCGNTTKLLLSQKNKYYQTTQHLKFNLLRCQIFSSFFWILKESNKRHWLSFGGLLSLSLSNDTSMVENYSTARHLRQYHSWHQPQPPILAFNENLNLELYLQWCPHTKVSCKTTFANFPICQPILICNFLFFFY